MNVDALPEAVRIEYERLCDVTEAQLRAGRSLREIADGLATEPPVREFVLLNLVQCWLEDQPGTVTVADVLAILPELAAWHQAIEAVLGGIEDDPLDLIAETHEVIRELSHSGLARLYLVRHKMADRLEVFKAFKPSAAPHETLGDRIKDEAQRAVKVRHSGLVQVHHAGAGNGWIYLLMEYMDGGSLADRLRSGAIPWEIAVRQFAMVARALEALHSKGPLAHGDIKCANLLYTRSADLDEERLKIADFGLSSELHATEDNGPRRFVLGTPGYLAPELLEQPTADLPFDERVTADVFALGVSLYEAITGSLPYQQPGTVDPRGPLVHPYVAIDDCIAGLPPLFVYCVRRACAVDRADRFASAGEFARALEACVPLGSQAPQPVPVPATPAPTSASPSPNLASWGWLAALAVFVLIAGRMLLWPAGQETPLPSPQPLLAGTPREKEPEPPKPLRPARIEDADVAALVKAKWDRAAAEAVCKANRAWWSALRSQPHTAKLADEQVLRLASLGGQDHDLELFRTHIHAAPAVALLKGQDEGLARTLEETLRDGHDTTLPNLLVQYPFSDSADACVAGWTRHRDALRSLQKHGLFGAERFFISGRREDPFTHWAHDLLAQQVQRHPREAANLLAILFEQHRAVARRVQASPEFANRLVSDYWPKFLTVARATDERTRNLALQPGIWDVLRLDGGDKLLHRYHEAAIFIFSGDEAFPEAIRNRAIEHLRDGYRAVVVAFTDPTLRASSDFHELMRKGLKKEVFAVLCQRIKPGEKSSANLPLLAELRNTESARLEIETEGVDVGMWGAESILPQLVYLRLTLKLASGESLYSVEKASVFRQLASDVVTYVLPVTPLDQEFVKNFQSGFSQGQQIGEQIGKSLLEAEKLSALLAFQPRPAGGVDLRGKSKELREALQGIVNAIGSQQPEPLFDISSTRELFEALVREGSEMLRLDMRQVRVYRLADGRLFALPSAEWFAKLDNAEVRRYFETRTLKLRRFLLNAADDAEAELAYRELLAAWWLLGASNRLPSTR